MKRTRRHRRLPRGLCVSAVWLLASEVATAFNMDPVARPRGLFWLPRAIMDKVKEPVHEIMTVIAYDCHQDVARCAGKRVDWKRTKLSTKLGRLIDGVEWNDDPTLKLRNPVSAVQWAQFMSDAATIAGCRREGRPGKTCKMIDSTDDLVYRSHYGDLQFLHAMGSSVGEPASETRARMLVWAEYTYKLAIGQISSEQPLSQLSDLGVDRYIQRGSWTSRLLFTRNKADMRTDTPKIALGSLLHMVQDSYSDAHTNRQGSCNKLVTRKGAIGEFHNYALQAPGEHSRADMMPEWLFDTMLAGGNPVTASAELIKFALEKEPWERVRSWLADDVFLLAEQPRGSGAGDPDCFVGD